MAITEIEKIKKTDKWMKLLDYYNWDGYGWKFTDDGPSLSDCFVDPSCDIRETFPELNWDEIQEVKDTLEETVYVAAKRRYEEENKNR